MTTHTLRMPGLANIRNETSNSGTGGKPPRRKINGHLFSKIGVRLILFLVLAKSLNQEPVISGLLNLRNLAIA
jgi:hypothetical protein